MTQLKIYLCIYFFISCYTSFNCPIWMGRLRYYKTYVCMCILLSPNLIFFGNWMPTQNYRYQFQNSWFSVTYSIVDSLGSYLRWSIWHFFLYILDFFHIKQIYNSWDDLIYRLFLIMLFWIDIRIHCRLYKVYKRAKLHKVGQLKTKKLEKILKLPIYIFT